jgi:hypothetical protein
MRAVSLHRPWLSLIAFVVLPAPAFAQSEPRCVILCAPEFKIEPTWTIENLFSAPRIEVNGEVELESRETIFEMIFALDVPTSIPRSSRHFATTTTSSSRPN